MSTIINGEILPDMRFAYPYRILLSGSSGAGKTYLAKQVLQHRDIFQKKTKRVVYFYPCFLEEKPVQWDDIGIPVSYRVGLPSQEEIDEIPAHSTIVLDDLYEEAIQSQAIDHLFRVTSGKRNLNVMIMTQNNYAQGKYGRNIKLNCNATFLCRNCLDGTVNKRACSQAGLLKAYKRASEENKSKQYPYMFLDQSPRGHASSYRLYTDIFSKYPVVFSVSGMKACIVPYNDFKQNFNIIDRDNTFEAVEKKHEKKNSECKTIETTRVKSKIRCDSFTEDSSESEVERSRSRKRSKKSKVNKKSKKKAKKRRRHSTSSEASSENISSDEVNSKSKQNKRRSLSTSSESAATSNRSSEEVSSGGSDSSPVRKRGKRSSVLSESSGVSQEE